MTPNTINPLTLTDEQPPAAVFAQLNTVRDSGRANMFDLNAVAVAATFLKCRALTAYLRGMSARKYGTLLGQWDAWRQEQRRNAPSCIVIER